MYPVTLMLLLLQLQLLLLFWHLNCDTDLFPYTECRDWSKFHYDLSVTSVTGKSPIC